MKSKLQTHIHTKALKQELPPFIIYEHQIHDDAQIDQSILNLTGLKALTHPDIQVISPDEGAYRVDDGNLEQLNKYLAGKPLIEKVKWVIWKNSELLTPVILNKLLKILEEPPVYAQIIFLHFRGAPVLSTIRSRAIFFREEADITKNMTATDFNKLSAKDAFAKAREFDTEEEANLIELMVDKLSTFQSSDELLNEMRNIESNRAFHQSAQHRLFRYQSITQKI